MMTHEFEDVVKYWRNKVEIQWGLHKVNQRGLLLEGVILKYMYSLIRDTPKWKFTFLWTLIHEVFNLLVKCSLFVLHQFSLFPVWCLSCVINFLSCGYMIYIYFLDHQVVTRCCLCLVKIVLKCQGDNSSYN